MGCKQNPDTPEHKHLPTIAEAVKIILKDLTEENEKLKAQMVTITRGLREGFACITALKEENEKLVWKR
jgi:hypothetical protein